MIEVQVRDDHHRQPGQLARVDARLDTRAERLPTESANTGSVRAVRSRVWARSSERGLPEAAA
jgi:hypothetical protein